MERRPSKPTPRTKEEIIALLPDFDAAFNRRPPVVGTGLGEVATRRGSSKFVLYAYTEAQPTSEQLKTLQKTFRRAQIRYYSVGSLEAQKVN